MDHIAGLVNGDVAKEFIELWQVSKPGCFTTKLILGYCQISCASGFCKTRVSATTEELHDHRNMLCYQIRAMFHEVWELERFQTAKVTFNVIQGHWQWCYSIGHTIFY